MSCLYVTDNLFLLLLEFLDMPFLTYCIVTTKQIDTSIKSMTEELLKYKEFVQMLSDNSDTRVFLNKGEKHALVVLERIFRRSSKTVRIFAGNLCRTVGKEADYIAALSDFIDRGGRVRILLNDFDENLAKESDLYKRLAYFKHLGKDIIVKTTKAKPYQEGDPDQKEIHFTVGDEIAYRIETDIKQRSAQCCMNGIDTANMTVEFFDGLFDSEESKEVDLLTMFGYQ